MNEANERRVNLFCPTVYEIDSLVLLIRLNELRKNVKDSNLLDE